MTTPLLPLWFALGSCLILWLVSLRIRDVSIIDIFWGPGIAGVVDIAAWQSGIAGERAVIALLLVNAWALRLAAHIWIRHATVHRGEDHRYGAMRKKFGPSWWWWSLFQIFILQAILIWIIPAPLVAAVRSGAAPLGLLDYVGIVAATGGLLFEIIADGQLTRFRNDTANKGKVMDRGLWGLSRHPNYFGETLMWWGFFLIGFGGTQAWWTIIGPVIVTFLLLKVSGVTLMEEDIADRRPAYATYKKRVSAFVPWFRTP